MVTALVEETHDLVEEQLPEIEIERLREILRYDRPWGVATLSEMTCATAVSFPLYAYVARGYLR